MPTYYDILEVNSNAGNAEIKAAFRRLAKLYHPDKNPAGTEYFERVLVAYEVLIDPNRRSQYDLKLKYGARNPESVAKSSSKKKEWSFNEEELKKRKYYQENYKKHFEQSRAQGAFVNKKSYNEYKYILFATPLAVALFMFVINGFEKGNPVKNKEHRIVNPVEKSKMVSLKHGDEPYTDYFKDPVYAKKNNQTLVLKNMSGYEGVFCLFGKQDRFLRCCYIDHGNFAELSELPKEEIKIKMVFGKDWNSEKKVKESGAVGVFENPFGYFECKGGKNFSYSITFDESNLRAFEMISEKDFFKKTN